MNEKKQFHEWLNIFLADPVEMSSAEFAVYWAIYMKGKREGNTDLKK